MNSIAHSTVPTRRHLLSALASLPLVGGAVSVIGSPTAAAVPVTDAMMRRYLTFLACEQQTVALDLLIRQSTSSEEMKYFLESNVPIRWNPQDPAVHPVMCGEGPSVRAALVLSAAGVPLN